MKYTPQQKKAFKLASKEADKRIKMISVQELKETIQTGEWLIYFGAHWCINTAIFNPKYLRVQDQYKSNDISIAKVECTTDHEKTCTDVFQVDAYPTLNFYINGTLKEEFPGPDEEDDLLNYLYSLPSKYQMNTTQPLLTLPVVQALDTPIASIDTKMDTKMGTKMDTIVSNPIHTVSTSHTSTLIPFILCFAVIGLLIFPRNGYKKLASAEL